MKILDNLVLAGLISLTLLDLLFHNFNTFHP